ncbi:hypothetical protein [Novosphingobium sp.]|uniref:hypothetical protein n=1 Tax=Novosphingobium sp. TaxID=1874826 RepID=UPI00286DF090|nr:hypothetical protein [Novosphingobium sp.]
MNKFLPLALAATLASFSVLPVAVHAEEATQSITAGKSLYSAKGNRIAAIYRVTQAGAVQVILEGKLITVPTDTLSQDNGKVVTTLTKAELLKSR